MRSSLSTGSARRTNLSHSDSCTPTVGDGLVPPLTRRCGLLHSLDPSGLLEPGAVQAARPVLWGPRPSNGPGLPDRALRNPVVVRKNCYGSGSVWAATLAARVWAITATAARAGCNPLTYLTAYLDACARASGRAPANKAIEAFLPWAATQADLATWKGVPRGPGP